MTVLEIADCVMKCCPWRHTCPVHILVNEVAGKSNDTHENTFAGKSNDTHQ